MSEPDRRPADAAGQDRHQFGTFGGVFTPSILTILGVIMFMRANFVLGHAGVLGAIVILVIAKSITFTTTLSISAVATNMRVRGGGTYYMISRVLGPEFGGAIGIALFCALALSVPFYILGFTEALCRSFEVLSPHFQMIAIGTAAVFFVIAYVGAGWAIRTQYLIMTFLVLAIAAFLGGAIEHFSLDTFRANWESLPRLDAQSPERYLPGIAPLGFWAVFAIYFPAVTGIDAGVNMSGDLKDPGRSIPRGALAAVGVGFLVYLVEIFLSGGAYARRDLIETPYQLLRDNAIFGTGVVVMLGVFAATLSSALGSYLSSPRVLQAVSRDPVLRFLRPFARGTAKRDEPRRALLFVGAITLAVLLWAGNEAEGKALNLVASVVTMFFLYTYGMMNLAAFTEAVAHNPSFRPRFRYFHWATALAGGLGCVAVSFLVQPVAAGAAVVLIGGLYWYVRSRNVQRTFGDARRGFVYAAARRDLLHLATMEEDPRNWRPTILVFSGNPDTRQTLVRYADWLESGRGFVLLANILKGSTESVAEFGRMHGSALRQLRAWCAEHEVQAFPLAVVADTVEEGMAMLLQTASVGPVRPNLAMFGWTATAERAEALAHHLRLAAGMGMTLVLVYDRGLPELGPGKRIDVWWRGQRNGAVMMILAYLLSRNWEWENARIRILRVVDREEGRGPALEALNALIMDSRVEAEGRVLVNDSEDPFVEFLRRESADADCVFLGFDLPEQGAAAQWHRTRAELLAPLPTTLLVSSTTSEDLLA